MIMFSPPLFQNVVLIFIRFSILPFKTWHAIFYYFNTFMNDYEVKNNDTLQEKIYVRYPFYSLSLAVLGISETMT